MAAQENFSMNPNNVAAKNYAISDTVYAKATYQSVEAGMSVEKGTVITVKFLYDDRD